MYYHYYEYPYYHHVQPHYGIRTERYKLIHFYYDIDQWELYDLQSDPNELNNLIGNDKYADIIPNLKSELYNLKKNYGNNLSLEELRFISDNDFGGLESNKGKKWKFWSQFENKSYITWKNKSNWRTHWL